MNNAIIIIIKYIFVYIRAHLNKNTLQEDTNVALYIEIIYHAYLIIARVSRPPPSLFPRYIKNV